MPAGASQYAHFHPTARAADHSGADRCECWPVGGDGVEDSGEVAIRHVHDAVWRAAGVEDVSGVVEQVGAKGGGSPIEHDERWRGGHAQ